MDTLNVWYQTYHVIKSNAFYLILNRDEQRCIREILGELMYPDFLNDEYSYLHFEGSYMAIGNCDIHIVFETEKGYLELEELKIERYDEDCIRMGWSEYVFQNDKFRNMFKKLGFDPRA